MLQGFEINKVKYSINAASYWNIPTGQGGGGGTGDGGARGTGRDEAENKSSSTAVSFCSDSSAIKKLNIYYDKYKLIQKIDLYAYL